MSQEQPQWLIYAIASGGCAALNGAFAKLTTTRLTTTWAAAVSRLAGFDDTSVMIEYIIRGSFFLMNLIFNGVMWGLFTKALTLATSTVRVSVINTSANFMVTAVLGAVIFGEELPALWWLGAGLLVSGSVIIGRREEDVVPQFDSAADVAPHESKKDSAQQSTDAACGTSTANARSSTPNTDATRRSPRLKR